MGAAIRRHSAKRMTTTRRRFMQTAAIVAASRTVARLTAQALPPPVKTVRTSVLEIGYHETGSTGGFPIVLLHGFPDDAHAYDGVAPLLAARGYRALSVYLRGFGPTRFLDASAPRTAEQAAIGQDVIDFADALQLRRFAVAGFDWGGRAACIASALHPDRVRAAVLVSGYTIQNTAQRGAPAPPDAARRLWYQWYFNTDAGRDGLAQNRRALCALLWHEGAPAGAFTHAMFNFPAASFDHPGFVGCGVHFFPPPNPNPPRRAPFLP